ncbi:hypothetical protein GRZ55_07130 [Chelativorans sp. ZYF759]|uniref:hypothetical protein n=1 Tax=Chelativorans sp. ZYF759 TaxID=2692213 RepID=UPI00145F42F1|nr:hypothetical protein [Chelativorans sp. ZYF759]NMG39010.1 hypothetical protein [Chelativorans sp. ZYF759]
MLARRFTIVCLIAAIFGMGLAMLVAQSSPPAHSLNHQASGCGSAIGFSCLPPRTWQERPFR